MDQYNVSLSVGTDAETPEAAAQYFKRAVAEGLRVTVENCGTGESFEVMI